MCSVEAWHMHPCIHRTLRGRGTVRRQALQVVELEKQLQDANNKFLKQSLETGCLACRRAKLGGGPPRQ